MKMTKILAAAVAAIAMGTAAFALDGRTVMQNAHDIPEPKFTHALVTMELIEKSGAKETRIVEEWGRSKNDLADVVMEFKSPASVAGTRFMQSEQGAGKDDIKKIYMPALKKVRPVAAAEGSSSFMGTDATYDDMSTRDVDDDTHELLAEESKNGYNCAKVKSTPKDLKGSQYSYRISWVDKETWTPVYVEMYDKTKNQALVKTLEVKKLKVISGYPTPLENVMTNVQTGHSTRLAMDEAKLQFDRPVPDAVFSDAFLANGAKIMQKK